MSSAETLPAVSVIVPVFNTRTQYIQETLESIARQTLHKHQMEIIIVDDCSHDTKTVAFLQQLQARPLYKGIALRIVWHDTNRWLAEVRKTGARLARGRFLCFLDSDDTISRSYLKKACLLLDVCPQAGWVYPNVQGFGYIHYFRDPPPFSVWKLFLDNYCGTASLYRKEAWLRAGQRELFITGNVRAYEDWDTLLGLMARGWFGLPLRDATFYYRQHYKSLVVRNPKLHVVSKLFMWRSNIWNIAFLCRAACNVRRYAKEHKKAVTRLNKSLGHSITKRLCRWDRHGRLPAHMLFLLLMSPKRFVHAYFYSRSMFTDAEKIAGLRHKPRLASVPGCSAPRTDDRTILFLHPWWQMGGAEQVLLHWMQAARAMSTHRIIDVAIESYGRKGFYKDQFAQYAHEQHALDHIVQAPHLRLQYLWRLVHMEQPQLCMISTIAYGYILAPLLKKHFPSTTIVDMLHCEDGAHPAWFFTADEYRTSLDHRIVISDFWKRVLMEKYQESPHKIFVAKNAVDTRCFDPQLFDGRALRQGHGFGADTCTIGFIGRFDHQKNPFAFVELARRMLAHPSYDFFMVGDGDLQQAVKDAAVGLNNLRIFDSVKNVAPYLALCDVLVCPSLYEGFPLIGLEAASMNVPVVATNTPGFREQIAQGRFGILYEPTCEAEKDAKIIERILVERLGELLARGARGRQYVLQHHDIGTQRICYTRILEQLLHRSSGAVPATDHPAVVPASTGKTHHPCPVAAA